jgi:hypothetical protein
MDGQMILVILANNFAKIDTSKNGNTDYTATTNKQSNY